MIAFLGQPYTIHLWPYENKRTFVLISNGVTLEQVEFVWVKCNPNVSLNLEKKFGLENRLPQETPLCKT